jgi:hypothetical protein
VTLPGPIAEPALPGRASRPGSVRAAAACFWLAAALLVAQVPQVVFDLATVPGVTREAGARTSAAPADIRNEIGGARIFDVLVLLVLVLLAGSLVLCATRFARGHDSGRLIGIIAACLVMLCCGGAIVGSVVGGHQPDATEFQRQVTQLQQARTPDWTTWLTMAALAVYPTLVAGMVLLLVGPSRRYFRPFAGYYVYPVPPRG